ncbi:hypothetical protein [Stenotrophomonas maltophilia]|uniref:hypothetical protein n=1 Tax=Stenotrophomonas maltophilia TaxID=40324 RepID=UPI001130943E|nr:hypothetical protein [Stenotrophomonas maltophilia]QGL67283.1 hypothetical protein FEO86_08310 [Stenotrophomonas maltophilia]
MNAIKIAGCSLIAGFGAVSIWLCRWLYVNRVFADPTALEAKDALAAQAAWAQAILSVLAVLAAIWVAKAQANQSRKVIEEELGRVRAKEDQESKERQSLARTALADLFDKIPLAVSLLRQEGDEGWDPALRHTLQGAKSAIEDFARVSPVLKQTPSGALHCFHIEEILARFANSRADFFEPIMEPGAYGGYVFRTLTEPDFAEEVAVKISNAGDAVLSHVLRL